MKVIRVDRYLINVLPDHAIAEFELSRGFHELLLKCKLRRGPDSFAEQNGRGAERADTLTL